MRATAGIDLFRHICYDVSIISLVHYLGECGPGPFHWRRLRPLSRLPSSGQARGAPRVRGPLGG